MSFMDSLHDTTKKKKQTSIPKAGVAQNAVTNHSFTNGKSRVQGGRGAGQGGQGWKSQNMGNGQDYSKHINPIISSLSSGVGYKTPKITKSLLSNEGFNQALGVIGARNNAKLRMQNKRVQQGMLGSLLSANSQKNALAQRFTVAGMQNNTQRRGQDFSKQSSQDALQNRYAIADMNDNTQRRGQDNTQEHNQNALAQRFTVAGMNDNTQRRGQDFSKQSNQDALQNRYDIADMNDNTQRRGQDNMQEHNQNALAQKGAYNKTLRGHYEKQGEIGEERNRISNESMLNSQKPKQINTLDEQVKRMKIIENTGEDFWSQMVGEEEWDEMKSEQQQEVKSRYLFEGKRPIAKLIEADWDDDVSLSYGNEPQSNAQPKQEVFKLDTNQTNTVLADFAKDTGQALSDLVVKDNVIISKKGKFSLQDAWETMNGN